MAHTLHNFCDEPEVLIPTLQCLYNFCYRCEVGQLLVLSFECSDVIKQIKLSFAGDAEVERECSRLTHALAVDGWRGGVEDVMDREFFKNHKKAEAKDSMMSAHVDHKQGFMLGNALETASVVSDEKMASSAATASRNSRVNKSDAKVSFQESASAADFKSVEGQSKYKIPVKMLSISNADDLSVISDEEYDNP